MPETKALEALLHNFEPTASDELLAELSPVLSDNGNFLDKAASLDTILDKYPAFTEVREYVFDLMMAHHLANYIEDDAYFDTKEWMDIEDKTLERGTELLNILLYVSETGDEDVSLSIDDFLYEFLLVDEDEFQDEHRIYEDLIANQDLVEESIDNIMSISDRISQGSDLKDLFTPLILFFQHPDDKVVSKDLYKKLGPVERAVLGALLAYRAGLID
jgi:hypothetical protein